MRRTLLAMTMTAALLAGTGIASAQFVAGQGRGHGRGSGNCTGDCTGTPGQGPRDGSGRGAKSGKRTGPQDGTGPIHTPQGQGRRGGRR